MKPITFRPTPDAMKALAVLMHERDCNRSQAINAALISAVVDPGPKEVALRDRTAAPNDDDRANAVLAPQSYDDKFEALARKAAIPLTKFRQEIKKPEWKK